MLATLDTLHRLTVDDVHKMVEAGVITGEDRVELVDGMLLDIQPPGPFHSSVVARLTEHFARAATSAWEVRVQDVLYVVDGFLSPDLMLVPRTAPQDHHHALLVIEVSVTSRRRDEGKAALYAAAGVDEYWRIDVDEEQAIVLRRPEGDAYAERLVLGPGDQLASLIGAPPVDIAALLRP